TDVLDQPDLADDISFNSNVTRVKNREQLDRRIGEVFALRDREANIQRLAAARIAYGRLSDLEDLSSHPQARFIQVATENGPVKLLSPGAVINGREDDYGPVPTLGEHDRTLRQEFSASDQA
ncbi:MAG: CoA transferase, partial [Geminicoccaceae bacterium]